jgi:hypothetical protein
MEPNRERNRLGGLARSAGLSEEGIGRFIDAVRAFGLDGARLAAALGRRRLRDVDLYGVSRLEQRPRPRSDAHTRLDVPLEQQWHGWTRTWRVRLYIRTQFRVERSFSYEPGGAEESLAEALCFRDESLRLPHLPRGPYHKKRRRPALPPRFEGLVSQSTLEL